MLASFLALSTSWTQRASSVSALASSGMGAVRSCNARLERVPSTVPARALTMADDKHLYDGASAAVLTRKWLIVDHHVGGERVERCRLGVNK